MLTTRTKNIVPGIAVTADVSDLRCIFEEIPISKSKPKLNN